MKTIIDRSVLQWHWWGGAVVENYIPLTEETSPFRSTDQSPARVCYLVAG